MGQQSGRTQPPYAIECYKKTASYGNNSYACRQLGRMYFNGWGTAVDYAQAVQWLEKIDEPEHAKYDLLGICYLLGHGCRQDPARGKALLERSEKSCYKSYGLEISFRVYCWDFITWISYSTVPPGVTILIFSVSGVDA